MTTDTHVLTGVVSNAGFSNWIFFFRGEDLVMIDVGLTPTLIAGLEAGIRHRVGTYGPQRGPATADDDAWLDELTKTAKGVTRLPYAWIASVRMHLCLSAHELYIETRDMSAIRKFGLMNRREALPTSALLGGRLGSKFTTTKSAPYAFFQARAPFLVE